MAESRAVTARFRILAFGDELLYEPDKKHSKDSFDQINSFIDFYEKYCSSHPDFKNNQTGATVEHIKKTYKDRLDKRDFL